MSTAANTLDVSNGEGENTRIHYVMSSGGRKLKEADIVLEGRISAEDIETIREYLDGNEGFKPDAVCVPDLVELMPLSWTPKGDERHDIVKIGYTNSKPTAGSVDADHFASGFQTFDYRAALTM
jgi:hypothetical protein